MGDPNKKITAPVGSSFMLSWTTPNVLLKNVFAIIDGTFIKFDAPKPKSFKGPAAEVKISVTKDGKPDGFKATMLAPKCSQIVKGKGFVDVFSYIFQARKEGVYLFTVKMPDDKTFTEEVTVVTAAPVNARRQAMLDVIDTWMPTAILGAQTIPGADDIPDDRKTQDLLARCGWAKESPKGLSWPVPDGSKLSPQNGAVWASPGPVVTCDGQGNLSAAKKAYNEKLHAAWQAKVKAADPKAPAGKEPSLKNGMFVPVDTSCISVLSELVSLWGGTLHVDLNLMVKADPKYYVKACEAFALDPPRLPLPGDLLFLSIGATPSDMFGHTCILVSASTEIWRTADGGGGALPDQEAKVVDKKLDWTKTKPPLPVIASTTDSNPKALHGWVNLDSLPNPNFKDDGSPA